MGRHRPILPRSLAAARGFSLMEVLISLSVFTIVLFAIYSVFESSQTTYATGEQRTDIQQNARVAMELMAADLRLAGYGCPAAGCDGGMITAATPTSITFWADLTNGSTVLSADVNPGNTTLSVERASGIGIADVIWLINGGTSESRIVTAVNTIANPNTVTVSVGVTNFYPRGSQVGRPRLITYSWAAGTSTLSKDDSGGGGLLPLADSINAFAFQYFNDAVPPVDVATLAGGLAANLPSIRRITITLTAQSPAGAWRPQTFIITSDARPRNL